MNTGFDLNSPDIEMHDRMDDGSQVFNCANSRFWSRLASVFKKEIEETYLEMRNGEYNLETFKKFLIEDQIDKIPEILYNRDSEAKYLSQGRSYLHMLHGRNKEHILRWLDRRLKYLDSLYLGIKAASTSKSITIRSNSPIGEDGSINANYKGTLSLDVYYSQYVTVKWKNGVFETKRAIYGKPTVFEYTFDNATDNEVLIYCAENLRDIGSLTCLNPSALLLENATGLYQLNCQNAPSLNKADISKLSKLQSVDFSGCTNLGHPNGGAGANVLDVSTCNNIVNINVEGTMISTININPEGSVTQSIKYGKGVTSLRLANMQRLHTCTLESGENLMSMYMVNCPLLDVEDFVHYINDCESVELDNVIFSSGKYVMRAKDGRQYKNLKTFRLRNCPSINSIELQSNLLDTTEVSYTDVSKHNIVSNLDTIELHGLDNLTSLKIVDPGFTPETDMYLNEYFRFNPNADSMLKITDCPKLTTLDIPIIPMGLKRLVLPDNLTKLSSSSIGHMIEVEHGPRNDYELFNYTYTDGYSHYKNKNRLTQLYSESAYGEYALSSKYYDGCDLKNMRCDLIDFMFALLAPKLVKFKNILKLYVGKIQIGSNHVSIPMLNSDEAGVAYNKTVAVSPGSFIENTNIELISHGDGNYRLYGIDFDSCFIYTATVGSDELNKIEYKFCTISSYTDFLNQIISGKQTFAENWGLTNIIDFDINSNQQGFDFVPNYFSGFTFNKNIFLDLKLDTSLDRVFTNTLIKGNVSLAGAITSAEYVFENSIIEGDLYIGVMPSINNMCRNSTIRGKTTINPEFKGTMDYAFYDAETDEAAILPIGVVSAVSAYENSSIKRLPMSYTLEFSVLKDDTAYYAECFLGCEDIEKLGVISDDRSSVTEWIDGTLNDVFMLWGGRTIGVYTKTEYVLEIPNDNTLVQLSSNNYVLEGKFLYTECNDDVDWGDGTVDNNIIHTYATAGTYTLKSNKILSASACPYVKRINTIGDNYNKISGLAEYMTNLEYVYIPSHVNNVQDFGPKTTKDLTIEFENTEKLNTLEGLLMGCQSTNITILNLDTKNIKSLKNTFKGCSNVVSLDIASWSTDNITDMSGTFAGCKKVTSLDVEDWNTSNVTTFKEMFYGCESITSLDLTKWDISRATTIEAVFRDCKALTSLDVSNWDIRGLAKLERVFQGCSSIEEIDLVNWATSNIESINYLFADCSSLKNLDLNSWDVSNLSTINYTFNNCESLEVIAVDSWNTGKLSYTYYMANGCKSLITMDVSGWTISNLIYAFNMFTNCASIEFLDVSNWDVSKCRQFSNMFSGCTNLKTLDVSKWDTSKMESIYSMFEGCRSLEAIDVSGWKFDSVKDANAMFKNCSSLREINMPNVNFTAVENISSIFQGCTQLETLNISNWKMPRITSYSYLFTDCKALQSIDLSTWNTSSITSMLYLFSGCSSLKSIGISNWDVRKVETLDSMFSGCTQLESIDLTAWRTPKLKLALSLFQNCSSLRSIDLSAWSIGLVTDISNMFNGCAQLSSVKVSTWDISNCVTLSNVFTGCSSLTQLDLANWDTTRVENVSSLFNKCESITSLNIPRFNLALAVSKNGGTSYLFNSFKNGITIYYNSSIFNFSISTHPNFNWVDISANTQAASIASLEEDQALMMLALSDMYEEKLATKVMTLAIDLYEEEKSLSAMDRYMITIYKRLIAKGLKTKEEVPANLQQYL